MCTLLRFYKKKIFSLCPGNMQTSHAFGLEFNRKLLLVLYNFSLIKRKLRKFFFIVFASFALLILYKG